MKSDGAKECCDCYLLIVVFLQKLVDFFLYPHCIIGIQAITSLLHWFGFFVKMIWCWQNVGSNPFISSNDHAKTSLYCRNKFTNYALLCEGISLAISTIFCSPFSHAWLRSSSVEVFTLWDTFNSRSIASCWYWNSFKDLGSSCWGCSYVTSIFSLLMNGVLIYTTSISNNGIILGFSSIYCSISLSSNPSIILIDLAYNGTRIPF